MVSGDGESDRTTRPRPFAHNLRVLDSTTVTPVVLFLAEKRLAARQRTFLSCLAGDQVLPGATCRVRPDQQSLQPGSSLTC